MPPRRLPTSNRPKRRLGSFFGPTAVVLIAGAGVVGAAAWLGFDWTGGKKANDILSAKAVRGELVVTVTERGELESAKSIEVACEVEGGGKIATIVPEGTRVKKGDEVVRFDTDAMQKSINEQEVKWEQAVGKAKAIASDVEVAKNKAEGEIAKAELALALAEIDLQAYEDNEGEYKVELDKKEAALKLAKKEEKEAEDNLTFTRGMVKKGFAQLEQIRALELQLESKGYTARQQEADLKMFMKFTRKRKLTELKAKAEDAKRELERQKKSGSAAVEKVEADLRAAIKTTDLEKKQFDRLKAQIEKCIVKAPQDGILIYYNRRFWDDSARIRPGASLFFQQPIFTIPDLDAMQVKLKVHESVVKKLAKGQTATVQLEALPNRVLHGKVLSVATLAQEDGFWRGGVKEYQTEVSVDDLPTEAGLRPGMTAEVKIPVLTVANALTVPVSAVTEVGGRHVCYVVNGNGVERREVKVGEGNEQLVQVVEGLSEGERVALDARSRASAEIKADPDRVEKETKTALEKSQPKVPPAPPGK
jgi:RND family efflux transporter MFP subunit